MSDGVTIRVKRRWAWQLRLALIWAEWKDRLAGRRAGSEGLTARQAREFAAWLEGEIAFHRHERAQLRGMEGMDDEAYHNKIQASALERARDALVVIGGGSR